MKTKYGLEVSFLRYVKHYWFGAKDIEIEEHDNYGLINKQIGEEINKDYSNTMEGEK